MLIYTFRIELGPQKRRRSQTSNIEISPRRKEQESQEKEEENEENQKKNKGKEKVENKIGNK